MQFAHQQMLGHHAARGIGGTNQKDGTKARPTVGRAPI